MKEMVNITISVPIADLIIDYTIKHYQGDRHTPTENDVSYESVDLRGYEYEVVEYDEAVLDQYVIEEWGNK